MKILAVPPSKIQNKAVSKYELERYFQVNSVESLIASLQQGKYAGFFDFDVIVSAEYLDWVETRRKLLNPVDLGTDLGYTKPAPYELYSLSSKIKNNKPLDGIEVQKVIVDVPHDVLEQYLRFRLHDIDYEKLRDNVKPKMNHAYQDEDYDTLEYNGLVAKGAKIAYLNQPIYMGFQHRQVVRLLLSKKGELCTKDEFTENADIFTGDEYHNIDATLRKLISAVRGELMAVTDMDCIKTIPKEGWYLELEP